MARTPASERHIKRLSHLATQSYVSAAMQARMDRMLDDALGISPGPDGKRPLYTSTSTARTTAKGLTFEGLLYTIAVYKQDFDEDPIPVALRAEPGTIAMIVSQLTPEQVRESRDPLALTGLRIEEDLTVPPRICHLIDHRGRIIKQIRI